jgi:hypothetical protein
MEIAMRKAFPRFDMLGKVYTSFADERKLSAVFQSIPKIAIICHLSISGVKNSAENVSFGMKIRFFAVSGALCV